MRINKYLAEHKICSRREADVLIAAGSVLVNGVPATLGMSVEPGDKVEVIGASKKLEYRAYYKPRGILTHSPVEGLAAMGRLDKDSEGLLILTNDGRVTGALLSPEQEKDKEYEVTVAHPLPKDFKKRMERGVDIGGYVTKKCSVEVLDETTFKIVLTEGKNRQIRRMCGAFGVAVTSLTRTRVLNVLLGTMKEGSTRALAPGERSDFLKLLGLS